MFHNVCNFHLPPLLIYNTLSIPSLNKKKTSQSNISQRKKILISIINFPTFWKYIYITRNKKVENPLIACWENKSCFFFHNTQITQKTLNSENYCHLFPFFLEWKLGTCWPRSFFDTFFFGWKDFWDKMPGICFFFLGWGLYHIVCYFGMNVDFVRWSKPGGENVMLVCLARVTVALWLPTYY